MVIRRNRNQKKRRNPSIPSTQQIKRNLKIHSKFLGDDEHLLVVEYMNVPIIKQRVGNNELKVALSPQGRLIIAEDVRNMLEQRPLSNPDDEKKEDKKKTPVDVGPVGLPSNQVEVWRLGYDAGIEDGINMCGIFDYFKREDIRKQLQNRVNKHFRDFANHMKAHGV